MLFPVRKLDAARLTMRAQPTSFVVVDHTADRTTDMAASDADHGRCSTPSLASWLLVALLLASFCLVAILVTASGEPAQAAPAYVWSQT